VRRIPRERETNPTRVRRIGLVQKGLSLGNTGVGRLGRAVLPRCYPDLNHATCPRDHAFVVQSLVWSILPQPATARCDLAARLIPTGIHPKNRDGQGFSIRPCFRTD
jgi:hypothetical protein